MPIRKPFKQVEKQWSEMEFADAIFGYLAEHPQASDTLEGIAEWWIMRYQVRVNLNTLKSVLLQLTNNGFLEKTMVGDTECYHLKDRKDMPHA